MTRCNCGETLPLTTTGVAHVCKVVPIKGVDTSPEAIFFAPTDSPSLPSVPSEPTTLNLAERFALKEAVVRLRQELETTTRSADYPYAHVNISDVAMALDEIDRLMLVNGQIAKMWCDSEDRIAPAVPISVEREPTIRFHCHGCSKSVTSPLPPDAILRAIAWCDECIESGKDQDRTAAPAISVEGLEEAMEELEAAYRALVVAHTNPQRDAKVNRHRAARSSLKALFSKLVAARTQGNKALNALIECGVNAGAYGFGEDITVEVPEAVSALRSEVAKLQKEMATREVEVADSLASAGAVVERLSADRLTPWMAKEILGGGPESGRPGYLQHHPDCVPPRDCVCNLFGIQNALRRLSEHGENET